MFDLKKEGHQRKRQFVSDLGALMVDREQALENALKEKVGEEDWVGAIVKANAIRDVAQYVGGMRGRPTIASRVVAAPPEAIPLHPPLTHTHTDPGPKVHQAGHVTEANQPRGEDTAAAVAARGACRGKEKGGRIEAQGDGAGAGSYVCRLVQRPICRTVEPQWWQRENRGRRGRRRRR